VVNQLRRSKIFDHKHGHLRGAEKQVLFKRSCYKEGEIVNPSVLANDLKVSLSAITHQINSLETQGLIKRLQAKDDRRVVGLTLSSKGRAEVKNLQKEFFKKLKTLSDHLGEEDTVNLIRIIKKISLLGEKDKEANA
jgi:DNA-binding MarR family transcriptional regulator